MNAINLLTREKLNRQYIINRCDDPEYDQFVSDRGRRKIKQEIANIERALETLKSEARKKTGVER